MNKAINSAAVGALVRQARTAAGLTQTELGQRIGASRFWVAAFEKGKPSAELGLALKALQALGLSVRIEPRTASERDAQPGAPRAAGQQIDLAKVIAGATLSDTAPSSVIGWPTASARSSSARPRKP